MFTVTEVFIQEKSCQVAFVVHLILPRPPHPNPQSHGAMIAGIQEILAWSSDARLCYLFDKRASVVVQRRPGNIL